MGRGKHKSLGHRNKPGEWIAKANARAKAMAPTHYKTIEQCLVLPIKVRRFGNVSYPKGR